MNRLSNLISPFLKNLGIEEAVRLEKIKREWQVIFNEPLSLHMFPFSLKNGELLINVDSSVWMQQISFYKADIIKKLTGNGITDIRLKLGNVRQNKNTHAGRDKNRPEPLTAIDSETLRYIDATVYGIQDTDLKNAIKKSMGKAFSKRLGQKYIR